MILKDRMRLHKLLIKLSQMGSLFIEIFDFKVLYAIYPMAYISRQYGKYTNKILRIDYFVFSIINFIKKNA